MKARLFWLFLSILLCTTSITMAAAPQPSAGKATFVGLLKYKQVELPNSAAAQLLGDPNAKMLVDKYSLEVTTYNKTTSHQIFAANDKVTGQFKALKGKTVQIVGVYDPKDNTIRNVSEIKDVAKK